MLFLNLLVALAKLVCGYATGVVSIASDGFHSLTDSASNVTALVGVRVARRPPDADHAYGHRKFETLASAAIFFFLLLVLLEVVRAAVGRAGSLVVQRPVWPMLSLFTIALCVALGITRRRLAGTAGTSRGGARPHAHWLQAPNISPFLQ